MKKRKKEEKQNGYGSLGTEKIIFIASLTNLRILFPNSGRENEVERKKYLRTSGVLPDRSTATIPTKEDAVESEDTNHKI